MPNSGNGQKISTINLDAVPPHVADYLADGALKGVRAFLKQPNGKEILEERAAQWKAERAASKRRLI